MWKIKLLYSCNEVNVFRRLKGKCKLEIAMENYAFEVDLMKCMKYRIISREFKMFFKFPI